MKVLAGLVLPKEDVLSDAEMKNILGGAEDPKCDVYASEGKCTDKCVIRIPGVAQAYPGYCARDEAYNACICMQGTPKNS